MAYRFHNARLQMNIFLKCHIWFIHKFTARSVSEYVSWQTNSLNEGKSQNLFFIPSRSCVCLNMINCKMPMLNNMNKDYMRTSTKLTYFRFGQWKGTWITLMELWRYLRQKMLRNTALWYFLHIWFGGGSNP